MIALAALLCLQDSPPAAPPEEAITRGMAAITQDLLRMHEFYLAGDALEGRLAGEEGERMATEYIAAHFARLGFEPVGDVDSQGHPTFIQHFPVGRQAQATARNCVGLLRGSDPVLADQIIVIGGHHDHVGRRGQRNVGQLHPEEATDQDDIWNGADDNASGTSSVLAIAEAVARSGVRPRRSILFMTFGAEEWGLVGSRHFVRNPVVPIERIVLMMNLDMVGRGSLAQPTNAYGCATVPGTLLAEIARRAGERADLSVGTSDGYGGGSDHASFAARRIPVFGFGENGAGNDDYHRVADHPDQINYDYMERVARAAYWALMEVAWTGEPLAWNPDFRPSAGQGGRRLGIGIEEVGPDERRQLGLADDQGAIRITAVGEESVAEAAGMHEGDVVLRFGETRIPAQGAEEALRRAIRSAERDRDYEILVLRGGERLTLRARWGE